MAGTAGRKRGLIIVAVAVMVAVALGVVLKISSSGESGRLIPPTGGQIARFPSSDFGLVVRLFTGWIPGGEGIESMEVSALAFLDRSEDRSCFAGSDGLTILEHVHGHRGP